MLASTDLIGTEVQPRPVDWEETRGWAEGRLRSAGGAVAGVGAFLGLMGLVEYALYQMLQNWTVTGVGVSLFGFF